MGEENSSVPEELTQDDKTWGMLGHLSILAPIPLGNVLGPLIVYLIKKDQSKFAAFHALQTLGFQIVLFVVSMVLAIPMILLFIMTGGLAMLLIWPLVMLFGLGLLIYTVLSAIKANNGEYVKYPIVGNMAYKMVYTKTS